MRKCLVLLMDDLHQVRLRFIVIKTNKLRRNSFFDGGHDFLFLRCARPFPLALHHLFDRLEIECQSAFSN